jgi:hypothetical protein
MNKGKDLLEELKSQKEHYRSQIMEAEQKEKEILESLTEKAAINCVSAVYKLRDMLNGKVKKQFLVANDALKELEELNPGFIHLLERSDIWETPESAREVKYLTAYLWASAWRSNECDFYRVLQQISDTIDVPGNPFAKDVGNG